MATGILINMIFMALTGIPMDMTTVMFSIVVVGVGVDNAIHLILQYRIQVAARPGDFSVILENTLKIAGRPIVITSISILAGFLIFSFASFKPIIYFGLLVAMALFTAALGTIIILPAILSFGRHDGDKVEQKARTVTR
jgi:predicted RND superfamily exporter protein